MTPALESSGVRDALQSWAAKWIQRIEPRCDWCREKFRDVSELREFLDWSMTLREAWPSTFRILPAAKVFCCSCAVGAIHEQHGGPRYVARRRPKPVPVPIEDEVPF